jgi:hypothetical protein
MTLLDHLTLPHPTTPRRIELHLGDLAYIPPEEAVDLLVVSAFPDDYWPTAGSLIGALHREGLSVGALAEHKAVDLRDAFSCWLSEDLGPAAERHGFRRLLCFEPRVRGVPADVVGEIFQSLMPFIDADPPIRTVAMPLVASGDQRVPVEAMLPPLLEAAARWMAIGMPLERLVIVERSEAKAKELARSFAAFKEQRRELHAAPAKRFAYDVFVSYSHQNADAADFVLAELQRLKPDVRVFVDRRELEPGHAWQQRIFEALDDCRTVVTLFSPEYLSSKVCKEEFNIALWRHRESESGVLVPVYLATAELPTYMKLVQYVDCREGDLARLTEACRGIVQELNRTA